MYLQVLKSIVVKLFKFPSNYKVSIYSNLFTFAFNLLKNYSIHATKYDLIFFCKERVGSLAFYICHYFEIIWENLVL
jgi:hypothetical protein